MVLLMVASMCQRSPVRWATADVKPTALMLARIALISPSVSGWLLAFFMIEPYASTAFFTLASFSGFGVWASSAGVLPLGPPTLGAAPGLAGAPSTLGGAPAGPVGRPFVGAAAPAAAAAGAADW